MSGISSGGEPGDILTDDVLNNEIRKRRGWNIDTYSLASQDIDLLDLDDEEEEDDGAGCPLPSTPEDTQLLEAEVSQ